MAHLALALLGPPLVTLDGRPVTGFDYDKVRALLAYLAIEADRPHRRAVLAGLLWPDQSEQAAHNSLRQALATLRRAIGDQDVPVPFLRITREAIQFNPASDHDLDVAMFTALLTACQRHTHRHPETCLSCSRRLQEAVALYRGDFLAQFSLPDSITFEEWALVKREHLHQLMMQALIQLADYHELRGQSAQTQHYASLQLEFDPWREEAHRQLMRVLVLRGQRSAALAQYERCRRTLADELGVEPAKETTALYERIRDTTCAELFAQQHETQHVQNFPAQTTALIGREVELLELGALLENPAHRLITIVGPGGIGKTRLALAVAAEQSVTFAHGAAFVPLASISSADFLAPAILDTLAVEQGQRDPREQLVEYLRTKELLLVLDNLEQLLAAGLAHDASGNSQGEDVANLLSDMLRQAPGITLLVTSRERLALPGEWLFDLAGLSYPPGELPTDINGYSAVQLFMQRAGQVRRQFVLAHDEARAVARICRLVEGLPLAIELAAAALRIRSCMAIAEAIEGGVTMLAVEMRAIPERHRNMWATFEHSWQLLSDEERLVFSRLSVFRGGFEEDAAAQVAQAIPEVLAALFDKSLLRWDGIARYDMHELIRQYAAEKLRKSGEEEPIRRQHALYFLALAEAAEPRLTSRERSQWLERLDRDHDNLRAVLAWSQENLDVGEIGLRLVGALFWFWLLRNYVVEGRAWAEAALVTANVSEQPGAWAKALYSAGYLAWVQNDHAAAHTRLKESVERWRETEDRRGLAYALGVLGLVLCDLHHDYIGGNDLCAESVAILREQGNPWDLACVLYFFGNVAHKRGDYAAPRCIYEESLALWRVAADPWGVAFPLYRLGLTASKQGDYATARILLEESLAIRRQVGSKWYIAVSLYSLAEVALCQEDYPEATARLAESLVLYQELGSKGQITETLEQFARAAASQAQLERAACLWGAARTQRDVIGTQIPPRERMDYERGIDDARVALGEDAFAAAWAVGCAMTLEQAIAYALEGSEVDSAFSSATTTLQ
jgi:predicted ATPase/DNA-binding SARP family transcriptional activator